MSAIFSIIPDLTRDFPFVITPAKVGIHVSYKGKANC